MELSSLVTASFICNISYYYNKVWLQFHFQNLLRPLHHLPATLVIVHEGVFWNLLRPLLQGVQNLLIFLYVDGSWIVAATKS